LAADLKSNGANVWLDQLDIRPGRQWDREVERALTACNEVLAVLSPAAIGSDNVMDEVAFALEERKTVIPVLCAECRLPFRLRRLQYIDLRLDYESGLQALLTTLAQEHQIAAAAVGAGAAAATVVGSEEQAGQVVTPNQNLTGLEAEATRKAEQDRMERERAEAEQQALDPSEGEAANEAEQWRMEQKRIKAAREAELDVKWRALSQQWAVQESDKAPVRLILVVVGILILAVSMIFIASGR
jgi:hypothetical protein